MVTGWKIQQIPGVIVRIYPHRVRIRIQLGGIEKLVLVDPDNLLREDEAGDLFFMLDK